MRGCESGTRSAHSLAPWSARWIAAVAGGAIACAAWASPAANAPTTENQAQVIPAAHKDADEPPPFDPGLLAGPKVSPEGDAETERRSLVSYEYTGSVVRLETLAELEALELLDLTEAERATADAAVQARAAAFDEALKSNRRLVPLLMGVQNADAEERERVMAMTRDAFADLSKDGTLEDQLATALPERHAERYRSLIAEYRAMLRIDRFAETNPDLAQRARLALPLLGIGDPLPMNDSMGDSTDGGMMSAMSRGMGLDLAMSDAMMSDEARTDRNEASVDRPREMPADARANARNRMAERAARNLSRQLDALEAGGDAAERAARQLRSRFAASGIPERGLYAGLPPTFRQEFRASYERISDSRPQPFERIIAELDLSPEREAKLRGIVEAAVAEARETAAQADAMTDPMAERATDTAPERATNRDASRRTPTMQALRQIMSELTAEERAIVRELRRSGELMLPMTD